MVMLSFDTSGGRACKMGLRSDSSGNTTATRSHRGLDDERSLRRLPTCFACAIRPEVSMISTSFSFINEL